MIRYQGDRSVVSPSLISALTARKLLAKGCQRILAYVLDPMMKVQVVKDFLDVFSEKLPEFPQDKENEFGICRRPILSGLLRLFLYLIVIC